MTFIKVCICVATLFIIGIYDELCEIRKLLEKQQKDNGGQTSDK